jgi:hypothetical protein
MTIMQQRSIREHVGCATERVPAIRDVARIVTPITLRSLRFDGP